MQAANELGVPQEHIVFVPGNHDVDWSIYDAADHTGTRWSQRYYTFQQEQFYFSSIVGNGHGDVLSPPYYIAWDFDDLFVIGYNSASHDSPVPKDVAHHGLADPEHIDDIRRYLNTIELHEEKTRLFIVHHHSIPFSDPIKDVPDFSLMTNAESMLTLLHEYQFDLLIHGHTHQPRFDTHSTATYSHLPVLCSGSFSAELDTRWAGTIANQFHLVSVIGKSESRDRIQGRIVNWANNYAKGWYPSQESSCGIHHVVPFGNYITPEELDALLEPFINEQFLTQNNVLWKNVITNYPDLEHLPVKSAEAAFKRMADLLGCEIYYNTSIHGLMLSKDS